MASMSISNLTPSQATQTAPTVRTAPAQREPSAKAAASPHDTVKLSVAAQANMMHRAGQSASQIAATLGTDVKSVDSYLNITVASQAAATPASAPEESSAPAAQAAPAEQAKPATPASSSTPALPAMTGKE
jgi:hypothetical protein